MVEDAIAQGVSHISPTISEVDLIMNTEQLALNQASYIIVRMLQTFSGLETRDDRPWQEEVGATLAPSHGCVVSLTR